MTKLLLLAAFLLSPTTYAQETPEVAVNADLKIAITNARSQEGSILLSVFNDGKAFPNEPEKAVIKLKLTVQEATDFTIPNLPPGDYAIAIGHDENNNGKIDKNALGIPKEGFGFSNNAMGTFGPPSFKKAKFTVTAPQTSIQIKVKYF